jgi:hypothetical protein
MRESVARLWQGILEGSPATDHVVAILGLVSIGLGVGALLLIQEVRNRKSPR